MWLGVRLIINSRTFSTQVTTSHAKQRSIRDYCDGEYYVNHPVFSEDAKALHSTTIL